MKLKIKRVQALDIGYLRELNRDFVDELPADYPEMDDNEIDAHMMEVLASKDDPDFIALIAYDGKKPAGFFVGYVGNKPYSKPRRVGVAQELYVVPEKRGGTVGLRLMEEAAKLAIERGAETLECIGTYGKTDKRWEKFGFVPHVTYGHMSNEAFMKLVTKFTRRAA